MFGGKCKTIRSTYSVLEEGNMLKVLGGKGESESGTKRTIIGLETRMISVTRRCFHCEIGSE